MATRDLLSNRNKAVVAFLDGRRMKGYIHDLSAQKDRFQLFSELDTARGEETEVYMQDLKAIFLARDFVGSEYREFQELNVANQSRKAEVTFRDGEKLEGTTEGYNPQEYGFFLIPADPRSNHLRVFVITRNAAQIRWT